MVEMRGQAVRNELPSINVFIGQFQSAVLFVLNHVNNLMCYAAL
jgi:hypothetical protein